MENTQEKVPNSLQNYDGRNISLDREWSFRPEPYSYYPNGAIETKTVNLPHDYMIGTDTTPDAPAKQAMGYYTAGVANYTKWITIPEEWKDENIYVLFDGIMMNASFEVNGSFVMMHHYGYTPFYADITDKIILGDKNRLTINVNPSMQPNSRWYTGAGIFRSVELVHVPKIHIDNDGIFFYTKDIEFDEYGNAVRTYNLAEVRVVNNTLDDHIVKVDLQVAEADDDTNSASNGIPKSVVSRSTMILVKAGSKGTARIPVTVDSPKLWSHDDTNMYCVKANISDMGVHKSYLRVGEALVSGSVNTVVDSLSVTSGIRTISCDAKRGLRINNRQINLKGGCIHHDNGIIGSVSLYDSEYRRLKLLKDNGFNAIRLAHNPPSKTVLEICDKIGLYVFDEAFDHWEMAKQPGDYNQFFNDCWKDDMTAFIERDRNHPCVIFWSTGNEIIERGGLGNGYELATKLADHARSLDPTRPITNAVCGFWGDPGNPHFMEELGKLSALLKDTCPLTGTEFEDDDIAFEYGVEPFVNHLDIVGYNYYDGIYEHDAILNPERPIIGTETFPQDIDVTWNLVEKLPHVIGDFTWTCLDYLGEAGLGKTVFVDEGDPLIEGAPWNVGTGGSEYPWRLAYDADFDINGFMRPQGAYRTIVWGSTDTHLFSYDPDMKEKVELVGRWSWPRVYPNWTWKGREGKPVDVVVYSAGDMVELFLNGEKIDTKPAGKENRYTARFTLEYQPGILEAVSYKDGKELSRDYLETTGEACMISLVQDDVHVCDKPSNDTIITSYEKRTDPSADIILPADGHSLAYISAEITDSEGRLVYSCDDLKLDAIYTSVETDPVENRSDGSSSEIAGELTAFGSAAPITDENYTSGSFTAYHGRVMAVVRANYNKGISKLTVKCDKLGYENSIIIESI